MQSFPRQLVRFLFFFGGEWDTCICLMRPQQVSVMKKYNNRRHCETHHVERYRGLQGQPRREKVKELIAGLKKQQPVFTSSRDTSATAVKASYLTANYIALASKPYSEGEFVKTCILNSAEIVCSEKLQVFANISLTRTTVTERISNIFANLDSQLKNKV